MPDNNSSLLKEFKDFVLRGNVLDLAIAVVIGIAFKAVIDSLVTDIITPVVSIPGKTNFSDLHVTIRHSVFLYGAFLNAVIAFVIEAAAVFLLIVKPMNVLINRRRSGQEQEVGAKQCQECLSEIPAAARRCAYCTSAQVAS
jgi:large conductance mechanosensitive channel